MKSLKLLFRLYATCTLIILSNYLIAQETKDNSGITLLENVINNNGIMEAERLFDSIKHDTTAYNFTANDFINLGNTLLEQLKPDEASTVLEMGLELFPESINILMFLATAYYQNNEHDKAFLQIEKRSVISAKRIFSNFNSQNIIIDNADDVIEKYIEATGGKENWESIETMQITYSIEPNDGNQKELVRMYKRPNLYRQGINNSVNFSSTNGEITWYYNGNNWVKSNTKYRTTSIDNYTINYQNQSISYEFIGLEVLNFNPVYHLIRTFPDGFSQDLYFSAESFLLQEIKSDYVEQHPFMESYFSLWDYREVEGVKIPYIFIRNVGPLGPPHGGVITDVQVNIPLSDTLFLPPDYR